jgi:TAT (twin-arginine translocation) pathway-exported protein
MDQRLIRGEVAGELSRRQFLQGAGVLGAGALVISAMPVAARMLMPDKAQADVAIQDGTLQAIFDTIIPGRPATLTDLGNEIHPQAIAGVDPEAGAVEADALLLSHNPKIGFDVLSPPFLAEVETLSLAQGGDFLDLDYDHRQAVCLQGLDFSNPTRVVWEAAAAVPFTAFCAAATQINATSATASGYAVMGHPGVAPNGYTDFSYGRKLSSERTENGYLP